MKLTKPILDKPLCKEGRSCLFFDDEVSGLAIRVYNTGAKTFVVDYRNANGTHRRMSLGKYGILTLDQARKEARKKLVDVLAGKDPVEEKRKNRHNMTVETFSKVFMAEYSERHKKSHREDQRRFDKHINSVLGNKKIHTVKRSDVLALYNRLGTSPMSLSYIARVKSRLIPQRFLAGEMAIWANRLPVSLEGVQAAAQPGPRVGQEEEQDQGVLEGGQGVGAVEAVGGFPLRGGFGVPFALGAQQQ